MPSCPDCEKTDPIIERIEDEYGDAIIVDWVDVSTRDGWEHWKQYNFTEVPAVVVNHEYKIPKGEISYEKLKQVIDMYLYGEGGEKVSEGLDEGFLLLTFSLGLFAGFSPCLMAILTFILAYGASSHDINVKDKFLKVFSFSLGLIFTYILMGILFLFLSFSFNISPLQKILAWMVGAIMILIGLSLIFPLNLNVTKPFVRRFAEKYSYHMFGLFSLGVLFSLVKLPCATPFLIIVLADIVFHGSLAGILSLFLFNLGLIIPLLSISLVGVNSVKIAEKIRRSYGRYIKIISGIILIIVALYYISFGGIL